MEPAAFIRGPLAAFIHQQNATAPRGEIMPGSSVIRTPANIPDLPSQTAQELEPVLKVFEFRVSRYYASLIDWKDPDDPLRRIVMPETSELDSMLDIDASDE